MYVHAPRNYIRNFNPGNAFLRQASGVPRFSSVAANFMVHASLYGESGEFSLTDPFAGNGTILVSALLNFQDRIRELRGVDYEQRAVDAARENIEICRDLEQLQGRVDEVIERFESERIINYTRILQGRIVSLEDEIQDVDVDIVQGNALTLGSSDSGYRRLMVTDPPYGNGCTWRDAGGNAVRESMLEAFLDKVWEEEYYKMVLAFDLGQDLSKLLKKNFNIIGAKRKKRRIIYMAFPRKKK